MATTKPKPEQPDLIAVENTEPRIVCMPWLPRDEPKPERIGDDGQRKPSGEVVRRRVERLQLAPGLNLVKREVFIRAFGEVELTPGEAIPGFKTLVFAPPSQIPQHLAMQLVGRTASDYVLKTWAKFESRPAVQAAIKAQLEKGSTDE